MRWIAASLLAINILVLAAQLILPRAEPVTPRESAGMQSVEGAPRLVLLDELDGQSVDNMVSQKERSREAIQVSTETKALCTMVGPFSEARQAEYLIERLAALDVRSSVEEMEVPGEVNYWVYLPPRDTRRQAFDRLRELQAEGIDSYVIPRGELANGISFGMFSKSRLARNRLEDMRSRGYAAELKEISRTYKETWVILPSTEAARLDSKTWLSVLEDSDQELQRRQNFCPPVASSGNFL